jgi:2-polyprenyl-3-methyl-5-hydroxy-6-metoxy-1,4-benzoquinol methylase
MSAKTDEAWEHFGKNSPYFGVLTQERFAPGNLNQDAKAEFFESGGRYVDFMLKGVRHLSPGCHLGRALDFGCGVGRLALPLARVCGSVVGVDVSESMLAEAALNAKEQGLDNVAFVKSDDSLSRVTGTFDLVHSFIVFQHIPPSRGKAIFQRLVDLLNADGIGVLHVTYSFASGASRRRKLLKALKHSLPFVVGVRNVLTGRSFSEPIMQMNEYDLNELLCLLQESGCHDVQLRFSETSVQGHPFYGVSLYFRKRAVDVRLHA